MSALLHTRNLLARFKWMPWLVIGLTLAILGGTILLARQQLRLRVREQIAGRDAEVLRAVLLMQLREDAAELEMPEVIRDPVFQFTAMLKTTRLEGVLAAQLFDAEGRFIEAFPMEARERPLPASDLSNLQRLASVSRFIVAASLSELFWPEAAATNDMDSPVPLLEILVPLHAPNERRLAGIAQFVLEGDSIAAEFAILDKHLNGQALAAFGVGGGILLAAMSWAFRRLRRAQELLAERTRHLLQANQELTFAAKTSAIGAVSAHLIHGLKNPLSGLQSLVTNLDPGDGEMREAIATARRMQTMIAQVVGVLQEEKETTQYEVTVAELIDLAATRARPLARERGVEFTAHCSVHGVLSNRAASLATLILVNLLQNAIEATPARKRVTLAVEREEDEFLFSVQDEGAGLSDTQKRTLFTPGCSSKADGSGIGLAISKQLSNHLGATLDLASNSPAGCVFALRIPVAVCAPGKPPTLAGSVK